MKVLGVRAAVPVVRFSDVLRARARVRVVRVRACVPACLRACVGGCVDVWVRGCVGA